jgi:hypothetical protein
MLCHFSCLSQNLGQRRGLQSTAPLRHCAVAVAGAGAMAVVVAVAGALAVAVVVAVAMAVTGGVALAGCGRGSPRGAVYRALRYCASAVVQ